MKLTDGEKLIVLMLSDLYEKLQNFAGHPVCTTASSELKLDELDNLGWAVD